MECPRGKVEEEVLKLIKPKPEERKLAERIWKYVREKLLDVISKKEVDAEVTLQGSVAKDTWLSGDLDIDVFVLFPRSWKNRLEEAKRLFIEAFRGHPIEERYAAHPYIRVKIEDVWVDIVPALRVSSGMEAETATDRTPFHTRYITSRLTPEQRDEVRLLKRFLKGIGVYGAEIAVQGFSGYLAELLIVAFKCFKYVLEKASRWKPQVVIDIENHYGGVVSEIRARFPDAPLVVIDPVDPRRNVAAAVSHRSLAWFVVASRLYLKNPSIYFFLPPRYPSSTEAILAAAGERAWRILIGVYEVSNVAPDVGWGLVKRSARRAAGMLRDKGFAVVDYDAFFCENGIGLVAVEVQEYTRHNPVLHVGPEAWIEDRSMRFVTKYAGQAPIWIDENGVLKTLRRLPDDRVEVLEKAKPKGSRVLTAGLLGDVVDAVEVCEEALRWLYRFVVKTPEWLWAVASYVRSPQLQKAS